MTHTVFETDRLRLRAWGEADAATAFELFSDPDVARYLPGAPWPSLAFATERVARIRAYQERTGLAFWIVTDKATGTILGDCGLKHLDPEEREIELGYHFRPRYWGKGYATEAAGGSLRHGFETLALERVVAVILPANGASRRVLEKNGMRDVGASRAFGLDVIRFELERDEWRALAL